eukprot:gnl/TRDRNA2_/TRDRNA2_145251_c0_seq1.p1 gnl/TRDRNA2_/TRDRNA2_145251_c0~~gnl/TRDRNA2_/TRDRNA2_145251_c0_seq1.p1  ORF type:complete len:121 (+),score=19.43 gnl/TRDRNA2_/TRDRNA2_145251_c0_seq1:30-392(+)
MSFRSVFAVTALMATLALIMQGCGDACEKEPVVGCIGAMPAVCTDADVTNDGDACCTFYNKIIQCHESEGCACDQARAEPDGQPTVKAYVDSIRNMDVFGQTLSAICKTVDVEFNSQYCA